VLILIPGSSIGTVKLCRLAACFMTFSRVSRTEAYPSQLIFPTVVPVLKQCGDEAVSRQLRIARPSGPVFA